MMMIIIIIMKHAKNSPLSIINVKPLIPFICKLKYENQCQKPQITTAKFQWTGLDSKREQPTCVVTAT